MYVILLRAIHYGITHELDENLTMKILITGNMGYVGSVLVNYLRTSRHDVTIIGLDTGYFAHYLTNANALPECRVDTQHFADVRCLTDEVFDGIDGVIHLAAISNDPMGNAFEVVTIDINYKATIEIAKRAKAAGARSFVFASSCSMYGYAEGEARKENSPLNPLTAYARSKVESEKALAGLASGNFIVTALRFATACGMSDRLRLDLVLNDFVASAVVAKSIEMLSDGSPWRPLIAVQDMARAIDWAVDREVGNGGEFLAVNTGSNDWNFQVKVLAESVQQLLPGVEITVNPDALPDKRSYKVNFDYFHRLAPNHQPLSNLQEVISGLKDGLEGMHFSNPEFRNSFFMRLKALESLQDNKLLTDQLVWRFCG